MNAVTRLPHNQRWIHAESVKACRGRLTSLAYAPSLRVMAETDPCRSDGRAFSMRSTTSDAVLAGEKGLCLSEPHNVRALALAWLYYLRLHCHCQVPLAFS